MFSPLLTVSLPADFSVILPSNVKFDIILS